MQTNDVIWLLERDIFHENLIRLKLAVEEQGMTAIAIPRETPWVEDRDWYGYIPDDKKGKAPSCVIYYGSIQGSHQVLKKTNWIPGVWCDTPKFTCAAYYGKLYDVLLNKEHEFLPFGLLHARKEELYQKFGVDGCIFLRPDSGEKLFTGVIIEYEKFDEKVFDLMPYAIEQSEMLVVAKPRKIYKEYRCVIVNGVCVAQSEYKPNQQEVDFSGLSSYAEKIARIYSPESCFVVDVAETSSNGEELELIELNSFSCSGWYQCNLPAIVRAASAAAIVEYDDIF